MAFYTRSASYAARSAPKRRRPKAQPGFAASPAGQHRRLAMNAFALAKRARAAGNFAHSRRMVAFGKRALALSRAEYKMFKKGMALKAKAFSAQRRALVAAKSKSAGTFARRPSRLGFR